MEDPSNTMQIGLLSDPVPVDAGRMYDFGAWALVKRGIPSIVVYYHDAAGRQLSSSSYRISYGDPTAWSWEAVTAKTPEGTATARILLYSSTLDATSVVWDDVMVRPAPPWTEASLGHPVVAANILDTAYGVGPDGREEVYAVTTGTPARFEVIDVATGKLKHAASLPAGAQGSWSIVTGGDGSVYVGAYNNGELYRWSPTTAMLESMGRATPNALYLWDLEVDQKGIVWGGTYPKGEVFSFDPASGEFTSYGSVSDEAYVRSVALADGLVYAGLGSSKPRIVVLDPATGAQRTIELPAEHRDNEFVYFLDIRGNTMFTRVTPGNHLLAYDLKRGEWIADLGPTSFGSVSQPGPERDVYYIDAAGELRAYNLTSGKVRATGIKNLKPARDFGWVHLGGRDFPGNTLAFMYQTGEMAYYNPLTGAHDIRLTDVETAPIKIQSIGKGPDGRIYVGGYMYEGISAYDPATGTTDTLPRGYVGQVEGMLAHDGDLYLGTYTRANLYRYDPSKPWDGNNNPEHFGALEHLEQDRPFAWASVGDRVAFGTVPSYGKLGGVLGLYDPATGQLATHRDVVPGQSIVSLAAAGQVLFGGTSVYGGLGSTPTGQTAKVFAWDTTRGAKLWEIELAPEVQAVTALAVAPDGKLWAIDVGRLYELDPATGQVLRRTQLMPYLWQGASLWVSADLEFAEDGTLYALSRGTLFQIEPATLESRKLTTGITNFTFARDGHALYYARSDEVFRLSPDQ
ncbi:PQQ-binding-like beta-propeller repeat protein [Micromonospora sp. DR5-3]|uniref:outer membrane protein assembly factor BamB family protein n=1 Tax=unclassified Micromonospora TaxID=2617518 RepID=UPI0011D34644|nr:MULTISPECIES: PQQ-binding-like beta-propeller repeat protein [unclassified Micromonospora]MCW3819241.1 PQQ-binding-like beta-propeller repeat protein [Micromonospora sp. DR5-3]TYC20980.1 PQQ-binding-like beta-propeller repeat protein [Micromonospora sp. MP36]